MSLTPCKFYDIRSGTPILIGDIKSALEWLVKNPDVMANPFISKVRKSFQSALDKLGLKANVEFISDKEAEGIVARNENYKARLAAYHGSPYSFDKFSTDKIGAGEGNQAFGWGLYFTDLEDIARNYAHKLSDRDVLINGMNLSEFWKSIQNPIIKDKAKFLWEADSKKDFDKSVVEIIDDIENERGTLFSSNKFSEKQKEGALVFFKNATFEEVRPNRNLYKVSINEAKDPKDYNWISWDKPINKKQSQAIQAQAKKEGVESGYFGPDPYLKFPEDQVSEEIGREVYKSLQDINKWSQKETSEFLLRAGIEGIKYPAESLARGTTSDNARGFNYVVFDENAVKIEEKIQFMKSPKGEILGFVQPQPDGSYKVWIDPATTDAETPIHELAGHIFMPLLKEAAPELHAKGIELIKNTPYLKAAEALGLEGDAANEEALAQAIGEKGKQLSESKRKGFIEWLNGMWQKVGEKLGISVPIKNLTLGEFTDLIAGSVLEGDKLKVSEAKPATKEALKESIAANVAKLNIQLGDLFKSDNRLGLAKMPEQAARELYEQHKALVETLKKIISDVSQIAKLSAEEFADLLGQKATNLFKSAYNAFKTGKTSYNDFLEFNEIEIEGESKEQGELKERKTITSIKEASDISDELI